MAESRKSLGQYLMERELLTREQLQSALAEARRQGIFLRQALVRLKLVSEEHLLEYVESELGIPRIDLTSYDSDPELRRLVPERVARKHHLVPVFKIANVLTVAMVDPMDILALDEVKMTSGCEVEPVAALETQVEQAIEKYYPLGTTVMPVAGPSPDQDFGPGGRVDDAEEGPIVRLVNSLLLLAVRENASDLHIEPEEGAVRVRVRVDGVLRDAGVQPRQLHGSVVSRIKVMSEMDISERRVPQDGRCKLSLEGTDLDLRVSTCPTIHGESVVIRLLRKDALVLSLDRLGMSPRDLGLVNSMIARPHGMMLVTGPTGSGKTTTLYSCLNAIVSPERNVLTLEDPVEYRLPFVRQTQVDPECGLTFARGLRSFLRQDPDVIMLGEVRDSETAEIAIRSALTGHLVLSTLHTNDAPSALARLLDMDIDPFLISSSVIGVVAQRLLRGLCPDCKAPAPPDPALLALAGGDAGPATFFTGKGCKSCNQNGYRGRIPVFEVVPMDDEIRALVARRAPFESIAQAARRRGMTTLRDDALLKARQGLTSLQEVTRVTGEDPTLGAAEAA
ncbi:MAG: Flp pilus assembly complex ATPase component TadA [Candidatus Eisenbacteria bacterium]|nr:Flp pilus assembly complex ATPase component TadA [Candidatus Eisenbacteria bacterium]